MILQIQNAIAENLIAQYGIIGIALLTMGIFIWSQIKTLMKKSEESTLLLKTQLEKSDIRLEKEINENKESKDHLLGIIFGTHEETQALLLNQNEKLMVIIQRDTESRDMLLKFLNTNLGDNMKSRAEAVEGLSSQLENLVVEMKKKSA